ncbi:protein DpdH [Nocardia wallacei]|uniref:protein DpdH n=1 Tax=Nocardia wallacei TaxID=480035 RepID=UPI002458CC68|nr:protein DpdH [Nocardia wallacei]
MTASFDIRGNLCWSPATAGATLNTEAVSPSPEVFFATHVPLRIRRRHPDLRDDDTVAEVNEQDVSRDFLERDPVNGVLLMPVLGESGSGKSHLVRWIAANTKSDDRRAVIYVEKSKTSLRGLIEILLNQPDIDSPVLDRLRERVHELANTLDTETLQRRLLNALAEAVERAEPLGDRYRRSLVGPGKLGLILRDPSVQDHLRAPGTLIHRLAASLLNDRSDGESDRPTMFTVDDLPHIADVSVVSLGARRLLAHLQSQTELQKSAVDLLTEHLSQAVQAVFELGDGKLQHAMQTIRKEYLRQGKEIVLLIEDFFVIQGLQRDLLEAIIEVGVREGRTELAPMRTLMAVTAGYYQTLPDTVLTRVRASTPYVYDLDVTVGDSIDSHQVIVDFVGRYLNAARLGTERLAAAGVGAGDSERVPNRCGDCPLKDPCHATFGKSRDGYGLFPFNWPALRRAIRARKPPVGGDDAFNPRTVIGEVIRPVLGYADEIVDGSFPGSAFTEQFVKSGKERSKEHALPSEVASVVEELDERDAPRRIVLLEFWGDAPAEPMNLDPILHQAFGIAPLTLQEDSASPKSTPAREQPSAAVSVTVDSTTAQPGPQEVGHESFRRHLGAVEDWYAGNTLPGNTAAVIRRIVRQAVLNRCAWNDPLTVEPPQAVRDKAWPNKSLTVSIDDAGGESLPGTRSAPIVFERTGQNAVFFKALLRVDKGVSDPGNVAALRRLGLIADRYSGALQKRVTATRDTGEEELRLGFRASLLGAALAGRAWPGMSDAELMAAAFDDGGKWELGDELLRVPRWIDAWNKHRTNRPKLIAALRDEVCIRRGTIHRGTQGSIRMVDAARVLPLLRQAAHEWDWQAPQVLPGWCNGAGLVQLAESMDQQWLAIEQLHADLTRWLPAGVSLADTVRDVRQALIEAQSVGLGPADIEGFRTRLQQVGQHDLRCVDDFVRDVSNALRANDDKARAAVVRAVSIDRGRAFVDICEFLKSADEWMAQRTDDARHRQSGVGDSATKLIGDAYAKWQSIVEKGLM